MDGKKQGYKTSGFHRKLEPASPAIMQSLDSLSIIEESRQLGERNWYGGMREHRPDITMTGSFLDFNIIKEDNGAYRSFLLLDGDENLKVPSMEQFSAKLGISGNDTKVKVVSIFGNSGDGKSYTMNHTFFNGNDVFPTSASPSSCTVGAMAAYDPQLNVICLDTEGLLGTTTKENQRIRLLLKILAISDVVIYRTRAERLHRDLYTFLGSASRAFTKHFQTALQRLAIGTPISSLGPAVIIFHDTKHTRPLQKSMQESPEDYIRKRFAELRLDVDAFSSIRYVASQCSSGITDFAAVKMAVQLELENTTVRSARSPAIVYNTLKLLNDRFSDELDTSLQPLFPDQYFTCPEVCNSCKIRCQSSMGHLKDDIPHSSTERCVFQHQYQNFEYMCKKCHTNGIVQKVTPKVVSNSVSPWYGLAKYVWSGCSIECPTCGELYSSRKQHWYGNRGPEDCPSVRTEIFHVWSDSDPLPPSQNTAQRVIDGVSYLSEAVVGVVAQPSKAIGSFVADQVAPSYWRPNHEITHCIGCGSQFAVTANKHHCRNCGEGVCESCSLRTAPVPKHGWDDPVRVCDPCYDELTDANASRLVDSIHDPSNVRVRRYGENILQSISTSVTAVFSIPKSIIKDSARPTYWIPDSDITSCCVCDLEFDYQRTLHHCRDCGKGVCDHCSPHRRPVPNRGWDKPVRICNTCFQTS